MNRNRTKFVYVLPLLCWVTSLLVYFRNVLLSKFERVIGDAADGQLIYSIHEHWFRFLNGLEGWHNLSFFYPQTNTLGYSDTFLGTGLVYSLFRFMGLDPYLSQQVVLMLLATAGFIGMFVWLHRWRGFGIGISSFCAMLFVVASPIYLASRNSHIQLLSIWQFPIGLLLIEMCLSSVLHGHGKLWLRAAWFGLWFGMLTYSTFYVAFFFGLLMTLAGGGAVTFWGIAPSWKFLKARLRLAPQLIPAGLILGVFASLFLITYLPVRQEMGGRSFKNVLHHLPLPWDFFNHSTSNAIWGKVSELLWSYESSHAWEKEIGTSPFLFFTVLFVAVWICLRKRRQEPLAFAAGFALLVGSLLIVRLGPFSFWIIPYGLIPGSEGIRAAFRFNLALLVPSLYLLATFLRDLRQLNGLAPKISTVGFLLILLIEQVQFVDNANLSRADKLARAREALPPPSDADAFYAFADPQRYANRDVPHNTAAYLAQVWNVPTINGRSGFLPPEWTLYDTRPGASFPQITPWARSRGITGKISLYDMDKNEWLRDLDFSKNVSSDLTGIDFMRLPPDVFAELSTGTWSGQEIWGIWSEGTLAGFAFSRENLPERISRLELDAVGYIHRKHPQVAVDILINSEVVYTLSFTESAQRQAVSIPIPDSIDKIHHLTFQIREPASPADLGESGDSRQLGIGLNSLILVP